MRAGGIEPPRPIGQQIFIPATAFAAARGVWSLDYPFTVAAETALGAARLVSTPSPQGAWLGIAVGRTGPGSPNLSGSTPSVSRRALHQSLLRLPVSPRPRAAVLAFSGQGSK